jgi:hypothetical protein
VYRIWFEGETLVVVVDDFATDALIDEFTSAAIRRAGALEDASDHRQEISDAQALTGLGIMGLVGGGGVAVLSCAGVPLTFWALGGTGWTCFFGIVGAVAGGGTIAVSMGQEHRASEDLEDAEAEIAAMTSLPGDVFRALQARADE